MLRKTGLVAAFLAALALALPSAAPSFAEGPAFELETLKKKRKRARASAGAVLQAPVLRSWMHAEVGDAWRLGFTGRGTTITVVDDFRSNERSFGNLGPGMQSLRHGEWTRLEASMVAPGAAVRSHDFRSGTSVGLGAGLNVMNLSYGMFARDGFRSDQIRWSAQESSLISHARAGRAVISKAAGNDGVSVGAATRAGQRDYLNGELTGAQSAIFVGALDGNGTVTRPASLAGYSNFAGPSPTVQNQFLVVGVEGHQTGLYGTSFAAPIVSGYAAVLGSKFTRATPTQITNQLLATARRDTVANFSSAVHGRGEASISRALAPVSIR